MKTDSSCPGEHVFLAIAGGDHPAAKVLTHIQNCEHCRQRVAQVQAEVRHLRSIGSSMESLFDKDTIDAAESDSVVAKAEPPAIKVLSGWKISDHIGRFRLIRLLGEGAFGEVYLAYDPHLDRHVAIKLAKKGLFSGKKEVDRFQREAQSAAQLHHPHIVPVFDVGQINSTEFIVYEFVKGQTLRDVMDSRGKLPLVESARLVAKLATALDYAHSHGIVHRDIKPENILVDVEGEPHIADFGLAYRTQLAANRTNEGIRLGTPAYMSPEQASGRTQADARSDIWSLGVLLREVLTGSRPFEGPLESLIDAIQDSDPRPFDRASMPKDLQAIGDKCLCKTPSQRYQSSGELAADLERWCRGEPVRARPIGSFARTARWARRNPAIASLLAAVVVVLFTGVIVSASFAVLARQKTRMVEHEQRERALAQVNSLRTAVPESVPLIIESLDRHRDDVLPRLRLLVAETKLPEKQRVRARLALTVLSRDESQLDQLRRDMMQSDAAEFLVLRELLQPYAGRMTNDLWMLALHDKDAAPDARFRADCMLALYDPSAPYWDSIAESVASKLLTVNSLELPDWIESLRPVREFLLPHLKTAYQSAEQSERRFVAGIVIAELFAERADLLVFLVQAGQPRQLRPLLPKLIPHVEYVERMLARTLEQPGVLSDEARANAAVALLYLGKGSHVWPVLGQNPDPSIRTRIVHDIGRAGLDPALLTPKLRDENDPFVTAAIILCLGEYDMDVLNQAQRDALVPELARLYRENASPGVHSAVDWLLRKWSFGSILRQADEAVATRDPRGDRDWYVNVQGQTLAILRGPMTFLMGSPKDEADRVQNERQHLRTINRSFAIGTKEVTVEEYLRFRQHEFTEKYSPEPSCPMIDVTWYDAVKYCRWLSEREGIPEDEMCIPPIDQIGSDMSFSDVRLDRNGYRLPTAGEWEYACRANAITSRHFGNSEHMLRHFSWYNANSQNRTWPVGTLKPNGFGLFDVHANALEWCQDHFFSEYPTSPNGDPVIDGADSRTGIYFELRGGTYMFPPSVCRAAWRDYQVPSWQSYEFGFRIARTCDGLIEAP